MCFSSFLSRNVMKVQVGDDKKADEYLLTLDQKLQEIGAKYDIVDCIPYKKIAGVDFAGIMRSAVFEG